MKKIPLILICSGFIFANVTFAQINVGVIGGVNITDVDISDVEDNINTGTRSGFGIGGVLNLSLGPKLKLVFEPMYSQKGAELLFVDNPEFLGTIIKFNIDYIEIPIMVRIELGNSTMKPYVIAGPTIGFVLSSKIKLSALGIDIEADLDNVVKSVDIGIGFGGGLSFPIGSNSLFIEGRYLLVLTDIVDDGTFDLAGDVSELIGNVKTKGLQIMG